jgi:hypothetical protein
MSSGVRSLFERDRVEIADAPPLLPLDDDFDWIFDPVLAIEKIRTSRRLVNPKSTSFAYPMIAGVPLSEDTINPAIHDPEFVGGDYDDDSNPLEDSLDSKSKMLGFFSKSSRAVKTPVDEPSGSRKTFMFSSQGSMPNLNETPTAEEAPKKKNRLWG